MKWFRFTIKTTTDAEDILVSDMYDIGLEGAQIEDKLPLTPLDRERMFVDIPPAPQEDDGVAYVSFFMEEPEDAAEAEELKASTLEKIRTQLKATAEYCDIGSGELDCSETEDLDWINNWKQYFHSFSIDDIRVVPSWEEAEPEKEGGLLLRIDPGTAFGTGMHETTKLCIRQLKKYTDANTRLLDVGTGSGILGILALKFGAAEVTATDLDPCAVPAVEDNCAKNGIDTSKFTLYIGNIIDDPAVQEKVGEGYDIAVANILAEVLIPLMPELYKHVKAGGRVITSGIIEGREAAVAKAMEQAGFEVTDTFTQGEWRCVVGKKP